MTKRERVGEGYKLRKIRVGKEEKGKESEKETEVSKDKDRKRKNEGT